MKSFFRTFFMGGVLLMALPVCMTSCEDILGHWEKPVSPRQRPLTLEAKTAGTIKVIYPQAGMKYSLNGQAKEAFTAGVDKEISVEAGDKVEFYGSGVSAYFSNNFIDDDTKIKDGTAECYIYGNIMSLLDEDGFALNTSLASYGDYTFGKLFQGNDKLYSHPTYELLFLATTLKTRCYLGMFGDCANLTVAPALPATTLADSCYYSMFAGCAALTTAPALPATKLTDECYSSMFEGCAALTTAPDLPATTLTVACYRNMFKGCKALTTAPDLPATTLVIFCYDGMFFGCSSLTETPHLPAATLVEYCYTGMFSGCTGLTAAYVKAAYDGTNCYSMFSSCTNVSTNTLYTDGDWNGCGDISNWTKHAYPTE